MREEALDLLGEVGRVAGQAADAGAGEGGGVEVGGYEGLAVGHHPCLPVEERGDVVPDAVLARQPGPGPRKRRMSLVYVHYITNFNTSENINKGSEEICHIRICLRTNGRTK